VERNDLSDAAFSGRIRLAIGRHALANAAMDDGLHGRGWYGPIAIRQPSVDRNDWFHTAFSGRIRWATGV